MNGEVNVRQLLATTAALLDQGRLIDGLSRMLTAAALIGLMLWPVFGHPPLAAIAVLVLVALAGAVELVFAVRVAFDATLFHRLAIEAGAPSFGDLDAALVRLALMPPGKAGRPAAERALGAKRLLAWQGAALVAQLALALIGGAALALLTALPMAGR
jgi:hypothetical protein